MNVGLAQFVFLNPVALTLLPGILMAALLLRRATLKSAVARRLFAGELGSGRLRGSYVEKGLRLRGLALLLSVFFAVLALARPAWNPQRKDVFRRGRDVVFVLDVSRSMLAKDVVPSRLESAKFAVAGCLNRLEGDRVGLIVFAGEARVKCPLTLDYDCFRKILMDCGQHSAVRGGSVLGEDVSILVKKVLSGGKPGYQDVILISDGEYHSGGSATLARTLNDAGARLIAVGVGDPGKGARIPLQKSDSDPDKFLMYEGREVRTRLCSDRLRTLTEATVAGIYFDVGTGNIDLGRIYRQLIERAEGEEVSAGEVLVYTEGFQGFLIVAVLLIFAGIVPVATFRLGRGRVLLVFAALYGIGVFAPGGCFAGMRSELDAGAKSYAAGDFSSAVKIFAHGVEVYPESREMRYNLGTAYCASGKHDVASKAFESVLHDNPNEQLATRTLYNLGNATFHMAYAKIGSNLATAAKMFSESAVRYRQVLEIDADNADAAFNMEIALAMEKAVREMESLRKNSNNKKHESADEKEGEESDVELNDQFKDAPPDSREGERFLMPTENPEDILEEERRNNEKRLKRIEQEEVDVEKDW